MKQFGKICFSTLMFILTSILDGYVFMKLWEWNIAPAFSLPPLSLAHAIGIVFFINYIKTNYIKSGPKKKDLSAKDWLGRFMGTLLSAVFLFIATWLLSLLH